MTPGRLASPSIRNFGKRNKSDTHARKESLLNEIVAHIHRTNFLN